MPKDLEQLARELMCIYWNDDEKEIGATVHALRLAKYVKTREIEAQIEEQQFHTGWTADIDEWQKQKDKRIAELESERQSLEKEIK